MPGVRAGVSGLVLCLFALVTAACGGSSTLGPDDSDGGSGISASLQVEPEDADVSVGDTVQFEARVVDASGEERSGYQFSWAVSDPEIASVDADGTVQGLAQGNVEVEVEASRSGGDQQLSSSAQAQVVPQSVASVSVSPASPTIEMGDTLQFSATVTDESGAELDRSVRWESSDAEIAEVDDEGRVVGQGEGQASVSARASNVADTAGVSVELEPAAEVEVSPDTLTLGEGETGQLEATVLDQNGNEMERTVSWSSSNTSVATVDPLGQVQAQVEGEAAITATSGEASGTAQVVVEAATSAPSMPSSLSVSEDSRTDASVDYTADWEAAPAASSYAWTAGSNNDEWSDSGSGVTNTQVTFTAPRSASDDDSFFCVRAVNSAGESEQACTSFTVPAESSGGGGGGGGGSPDDVSVTPSTTDVEVGDVVQLSATVTDSAGNELDSDLSWSSSNSGVATVNADGLVSGQAEGTAEITAEVDGISDAASVDVVPAGPGADPVLVEDFSDYNSTSELLNDILGIWSEGEDSGTESLELDTSVGLNQGGHDLSQSMRYDMGPGESTPKRNLQLPSDTDEVWLEIWVRFSSNFRTDWGDTDANADYKMVFGRVGQSRFGLDAGSNGNAYDVQTPAGVQTGTSSTSQQDWDGEWHRFRLHFAHESSDGACDGSATAQIDSRSQFGDEGNACTSRSNGLLYGIAIGRNMNHSPDEGINIWWGRIAVWTSDPGW